MSIPKFDNLVKKDYRVKMDAWIVKRDRIENRPAIIDAAIDAAGGGAVLARALGLKSRQAVYQWTRIPAEHCATVSRMSGIPKHLLRPDIFDKPAIAEAPRPSAAE